MHQHLGKLVLDLTMLVWITGVSGAGKTYLANKLVKKLRNKSILAVHFDGDELRNCLKLESPKDFRKTKRLAIARKYARLGKLLSDQGHLVIFSTISLFNEIQDWNRKNNPKYVEIFLNVPKQKIINRDQKQLISRYFEKSQKNIVGMDVTAEMPINPDFIYQDVKPEDEDYLTNFIIYKHTEKINENGMGLYKSC